MPPRILEGQNDANGKELASFVSRIEQINTDYVEWQMAHAAEGKKFAEDRREIFTEAKERGVNVKALRAVIRARDLERKAAAARDDLEDDEADSYDKIRLALGDLADSPLGAAALAKAPDAPNGTSGIVAAVKANTSQDEWDRAAPKH